MIKSTTALRKISALRKRIWAIQGGQGAGKTFAILIILINYAYQSKDKEIYIASKELSKMKVTVIKDFFKIIRAFNLINYGEWRENKYWKCSTGTTVTFIGLDKEDIGKGLRSDIVFLNEANKTNFETYDELTRRAKRIIVDYNPNSEFYVHTEVIPRDDCDNLILTYKDNEQIPENERKEIEMLKDKAYYNTTLPDDQIDNPENVKSKYHQNKWHIYGLGIVGSNPNRIFYWERIEPKEYKELDVPTYYGVDWGSVDPMGIIEVKYYDGALYLNELNYLSENELKERLSTSQKQKLNDEDEGLIKWLFSRLNIPTDRPIICDNNRKSKITALRKMGFTRSMAASKPAGSILDGIDLLNSLNVYYTSTSKNIEHEQKNYSRKVDRYGVVLEEPEDLHNHTTDPARYVAQYLQMKGVIKNI